MQGAEGCARDAKVNQEEHSSFKQLGKNLTMDILELRATLMFFQSCPEGHVKKFGLR